MQEGIKEILESMQLILRDRNWNNKQFDAQSKVVDFNITQILNPQSKVDLQNKMSEVNLGEEENESSS